MSNTNPVWTIHANGLTGPGNRSYLIGCHITTNNDVPPTAYLFTLPNITQVLSTYAPGGPLPSGDFDFPMFGPWDGNYWYIHVTSLGGTSVPSGNWKTLPGAAKGKPTGTPGEEDGTWTAQAGTGADHPKTRVKTKTKTAKSTGA